MPQSDHHDALAERFISIAQHILVVTFGLLPIFFIPATSAPFSYSKVLFVTIGLFAALILYGFALLRRGSVGLRVALAPAALWLVAFVALVSALLSGDFRDAFVGETLGVHTALFIALLALATTVWAIVGNSKAAVMRLFILLSFSTLVLSLFHVARLVFGADFLPLGLFSGDATLSPFGGWNDLAIFFGLTILLSLVAIEQLPLTKPGQALFAGVVAAALIMLAVINFFAVWVVLALVSLVVLIYGVTKDRFGGTEKKTMSQVSIGVSFAVLAVSVAFVIGGGFLSGIIGQAADVSYIEVRPSMDATVNIVRNVYATDALFGIGPNRFADAWRLFKDQGINESVFWSTDFNAGFGYIPTLFATMGILGGVAVLLFLAAFIYMGVRMLFRAEAPDRTWYFIGTAAFVGGLYTWVMAIVYVPGPTLLLLAALCTGLVAVAHNVLTKPARAFVLSGNGNRRIGVVFIFAFLVLLIGSVSALYFVGRHYASVYAFNQSFVMIAEGAQIDEVEARTAYAYTLSPDDGFARQLAEYQLARIGNLLTLTEPTAEDQETFNTTLTAAVQAAQTALAGDSTNPRNWTTLGAIYGTLAQSGFEGAYERAVESFTQARTYDPRNPSYLLVLAQLAYGAGQADAARAYIDEALALKRNYSDAIFFIAQMDITEGNVDSALQAARAVTAIEPQNPVRFFQLGLLHFSERQYAEAAAAFSRAITLNPDYANARYYRALAADTLGDPEAARSDLEIVLAANPGNELVGALLARLQSGQPLLDAAELSAPVQDGGGVTQAGNSVTTTEPPDTPLVSPVNAVEEDAQ